VENKIWGCKTAAYSRYSEKWKKILNFADGLRRCYLMTSPGFLRWRAPSCFLDVPMQHALAFIRKVVTGSLSRILLEHVTCIHVYTKRYPDIWSFVRTQETQRTRQAKALFRARCNASEMRLLLTVKTITGVGLCEGCMSMQEAPTTCCTNTLPS
jgi:hypothetical protein